MFYSALRVFILYIMQGTERLAKANRLQRDFEREVMNPKYICPMFILPDGKVIGKASDKEEYTAQLEESLKTTAKQKKNVGIRTRWAAVVSTSSADSPKVRGIPGLSSTITRGCGQGEGRCSGASLCVHVRMILLGSPCRCFASGAQISVIIR